MIGMILAMEIIGVRARTLGRDSRFLFRAQGGTIGSAAANTWVLADPAVSPKHVLIEYFGGHFSITDVGSTAIGRGTAEHPQPPLQPFPVRDKDLFVLGGFEILATLLDDLGLPLVRE